VRKSSRALAEVSDEYHPEFFKRTSLIARARTQTSPNSALIFRRHQRRILVSGFGVDGFDCHVIWTSKWAPREHETLNTHRGAALAGGKIIRGTGDGLLLALDAKDGRTLWTCQIADPKVGYFISMPPLVHGDLVYIDPAGVEWAAKGWVGAFRISDGEQAWRFNIVPDDGEPGAKTWGTDPAARKHGLRKSLDSNDL
jgi:hypothetical protein